MIDSSIFWHTAVGLTGATAVGLWLVGEMLPEWQTSPTSWLDWTLWPLLRVVWEPFSKKRSHWWHWLTYARQIQDPVVVQGHPNAMDRSSPWQDFFQTNFGWKDVVVVKPVNYKGLWHIGFSNQQKNGKVTQYCSILFNEQEKVAPLVGPTDTTFFAFTPEWIPIKLEVLQETTKDELPAEIPII
jgi:hypothetical protein